MINIVPEHLQIVKDVLKKYIPNYEVRAFGSRVKDYNKTYSDLDLVIMSDQAVAKKVLYKIEEEFSESDLPFRVEILDWQTISENFQQIISRKYEIVQLKSAK